MTDDEIEERILEKVEYVDEATTVLSRKRDLSRDAYETDREQRDIVEREFQTAIEACIDVARLVIRDRDEEVPPTNADAFALLAAQGVLSDGTGQQMQAAAGFRNVLAHKYGGEIDDALVYDHLQHDLQWFPAFLTEIRSYVADDSMESN